MLPNLFYEPTINMIPSQIPKKTLQENKLHINSIFHKYRCENSKNFIKLNP